MTGNWAETKDVEDMSPSELIGLMSAVVASIHVLLAALEAEPEKAEALLDEAQDEINALNARYKAAADRLDRILAPLVPAAGMGSKLPKNRPC